MRDLINLVNAPLTEAITNGPINTKVFVDNRIRDCDAVLRDLAIVKNAIADNASRDSEKMLETWLRYHNRDVDVDHVVYFADHFDRYFPIENLRHALDGFRQHGRDYVRYILTDHSNTLPEGVRDTLSALPAAPQGSREWGYDSNDPESLDEDYYAAMRLWKALTALSQIMARSEKIITVTKTKIQIIQDKIVQFYAQQNYRPDHEETEVLFHASAFCPEIVRDGFQAERPIERRGLGVFGSQKEVSFTHSHHIANQIARCLKEVWMIAHGQLTRSDILDWVQREDLSDKIADAFRSNRGVSIGASPDTTETTVEIYNYYLWFGKMRSNPVFTSITDALKVMQDRKLSDIGVLSCRVKLSASDTYKDAEAEFVVPGDRVVSVERLY